VDDTTARGWRVGDILCARDAVDEYIVLVWSVGLVYSTT